MATHNAITIARLHESKGAGAIVELAKQLGLLGRPPTCPKCGTKMVEVKDASAEDGLRWRCHGKILQSKKAPKPCTYRHSYRTETFFAGTHLQIWQILAFIDLWVKKVEQKAMSDLLSISEKTVVDWASFCREVTFDGMVVKASPLGGPGRNVEIDESKFGKRKYNRGHRVEGKWVFGGIERESGIAFMIPVENRSKDVLLCIIKHFILEGTTVISDCWKAYDCLEDEGYQHLAVNHSLTFKDPETGAHTNNIEGSWRHAKEVVGTHNRQVDFLAGKISKYLFLRSCRMRNVNPFEEFCKLAGSLYDGDGNLVEGENEEKFWDMQKELQELYDKG
jgi:transposase-like protein